MPIANDTATKIIAVGFSHLGALQRAYERRVLQNRETFRMELVNFNAERLRPLFIVKDGKRVYNSLIKDAINECVGDQSDCFILAALWGNEHFFLSAFNNPRPFDFVLPMDPTRELLKGVDVIPYDLMHSLLNEICSAHYDIVQFLKSFIAFPIILPSAPPPVEDVLSIQGGTSDAKLDAKVRELGVAPASLRYKFWRLCEEIYRNYCQSKGISFLPMPCETVDANGFRRPEYCGADWLHASTSYGELVLQQIDATLVQLNNHNPSVKND